MLNLFFMLILSVLATSVLSNPMMLLVNLMLMMTTTILTMFLNTSDYWTAIMLTLAFLVGLFLLFLYLVSLTQNMKSSKNKQILFNNKLSMVLLFFIVYFLQSMSQMFQEETALAICWYNWIFESNKSMLFFVLLLFILIFTLVFVFMKKNKKAMKSSF